MFQQFAEKTVCMGHAQVLENACKNTHNTITYPVFKTCVHRCHQGWTGHTCDRCIPHPDCGQGYCNYPMECICEEGYLPPDCRRAICMKGCNETNSFCTRPNTCNCKPGWSGPTCETCVTYPGCMSGICERPFECKCVGGYSGMLCDKKIGLADGEGEVLEWFRRHKIIDWLKLSIFR